jgi:sugar lactone lactonase YvrE
MTATILSDVRCHLGEGATYDTSTGTARWFDILERKLFESDPETGSVRVHVLPVMASALAVVDAERQVISAEDGLYLRTRTDGRMRLLHEVKATGVAVRSNDGRVHPCGTFWFSTMGRAAEPDAGAIYALHAGAVHCLFPNVTIANGICFAADGAAGFFADTARRELYRVTLDPKTGLPTDPPVPVLRDEAGLDGAVVDADGLIWIARWGGGRADVFTMQGDRVRSLDIPARQPSCPAFVGRALRQLLVTTALEGMDATARAADPHGGKTFLLDPKTQGRPEPRVRLTS